MLRKLAFTYGAIAIIKDVFAVWAHAKKAIYENKLSVKTFNVKTVGPSEVDKELAFNGYDCDPMLFFADANVPSEAVGYG